MHWANRLSEISRYPRIARTLWLAAATLVSFLHLFANTLGIAHSDMSLDDAGTWGVAHRSLTTLVTLPTEFHSQPPLYYYLLHFLLNISSSPWFLRGISWLFCWLLILFVLFCWDELSLLARLAFCLIFIFSGITPYLSSCVRPYGMAAFLTIVSTVMLLRLANEPSKRSGVVYAAWTIAMLYTMAFEVAVLLVHGLVMTGLMAGTLIRARNAESFHRVKIWALTMACVCIAYLPYVLLAYHYQYRANATDTWKAVLSLATYKRTLRGQLGFSAEISWGLFILVSMGLVGEFCRRSWLVVVWPLTVVGSIAFVWYFILGRSILGAQTKYMMPAFLSVCVLAALGFDQIRPLVGRGVWTLFVCSLALLVYVKFPAFDKFMQAGPDIGPFGKLREKLIEYPGKKIFFPDVGFDAQRPAYVTRNDPDIIYATQSGRGWASAGEALLSNDYVLATIEHYRSEAKCFFYFIWSAKGPYSKVFVPTMERLGFRRTGPLPATQGHQTVGYCRN